MKTRAVVVFIAAVSAASVLVGAAGASCLKISVSEQRARADVIFDGVALEGPTATGVQRFRVTRYRKGRGPRVVRVQTGTIRRADGTGMTTSISLHVERGERWRIFGLGSARKVLRTNLCAGSRPV
jgi:hypothetical protein